MRAPDFLADLDRFADRPRKYRNKPTEVDGIRFDSLKESRRYGELKVLQRAGRITDLEIHRGFPLDVNDYPIGRYECDFAYRIDGALIVEDVKSKITRKNPAYVIKRKLMRAIYKIEVQEV